jgi:hypothetical protein
MKITLTKKDNKGKKEIDRTLITDFLAITRYNDPNTSFKIYQEKRKEGKTSVSWTRGVLTEEYPEMKKKEIFKMYIAQLEEMKTKMKDSMEINWVVEE